ncbi:MAG: helix-turn-helix domain-containing protein [Candidatus Pacebacteria bacterium]|nr:helix-turn-helix domain-containing protein [Candidatus Paceibacterota bacterium]
MAYDLVVKDGDDNKNYISLAEGAEYSGYSQDYLRFRIRQGKLKAKKIGRNWLTTKEWLSEYAQRVAEYKVKLQKAPVLLETEESEEVEKPKEESVESVEAEEEPSMNEEVGPLAAVAKKDETEDEEETGEEDYDDDDDGLIFQAKKPETEVRCGPEETPQEGFQVFFNPEPMAIFQEAEMPPTDPHWLRYAAILVFLCGVLGFTIGFNYTSLRSNLADNKEFIVDQAKDLVKAAVSPMFPEQFTASFGIIFKNPLVKKSLLMEESEDLNTAPPIVQESPTQSFVDNQGIPPLPIAEPEATTTP